MDREYVKIDMAFTLFNLKRVQKYFDQIFWPFEFANYFNEYEKIQGLLFRRIIFDIFKFDEDLKDKFLDEYNEAMSMAEFISKRYGQEGVGLLKDLTGG
ncbi:MAG: hypothetical protein FWG98_06795 [Candidatus Cloacimonetes bacterium]|nr:hypothetical protein [Candidatus Cloacimonadota bacterium]